MWKISIKSTVCLVLDNRTGAYINRWDYFPNKRDRKGCKWWKVLIQIGDLFFKTPAIFNGEKKEDNGNILTLTPIVQA